MQGTKLTEPKVFIDANILVSASILYVGKELGLKNGLKHTFYDRCKTLINIFKKRIDDKIGIYTKLVDVTANRVMRDALLSTIKETSRNESTVDEQKMLTVFSVIYSECIRRSEENKDALVRETVNEDKINKLRDKAWEFFNVTLKNEIEKHNPKAKIEHAKNIKGSSLIMRAVRFTKIQDAKTFSFPHYGTLKLKFIDSGIGSEDLQLFLQALYFNELYAKQNISFYFCSLDHHFVEIEKDGLVNDFVPAQIKEIFKMQCSKPEKIIPLVK